jgi:hypothetical protein
MHPALNGEMQENSAATCRHFRKMNLTPFSQKFPCPMQASRFDLARLVVFR